MKTYELTIGEFIDSHTYGKVEHITITADSFEHALQEFDFKELVSGANREVIELKRIL